MGIRLQNNFKKRFGDRPFKVIYPEKPLTGEERRLHNAKIAEAVKAVLTGILKREPTEAELFGLEDISKKLPPQEGTS